jgi:hypothetical protein
MPHVMTSVSGVAYRDIDDDPFSSLRTSYPCPGYNLGVDTPDRPEGENTNPRYLALKGSSGIGVHGEFIADRLVAPTAMGTVVPDPL